MIGIYKIENLLNHKCYIGQSIHIERRWKEHCQKSTKSVISQAIKKYGKENFSFQILEECEIDELAEKEIAYIHKFNSIIPNGYNVADYEKESQTTYCFYSKEVLKEIIVDLKENIISLQQISEKYDLSKRTIYRINRGDVHRLSNEQYPLRQLEEHNGTFCIDCGKKITRGATRCQACSSKAQQKTERPEREELKFLIRNVSFAELGRRYGVSDNAIRKWCKSVNLPTHSRDIKQMSDKDWELI